MAVSLNTSVLGVSMASLSALGAVSGVGVLPAFGVVSVTGASTQLIQSIGAIQRA